MAASIRALEDEVTHLRVTKMATMQALKKNIKTVIKTYKETLEVLGDEHARRWVSERAPEELRTLDEVIRVVQEMWGS